MNVGGIAVIALNHNSMMNYYGGETSGLYTYSDAQAVLRGGRIDHISSYQYVWWGDNYVPHIEIVCKEHDFNSSTNILTGVWMDDSLFNIQLHDQTGYDPAIENIFFTPEPVTLLLFGFGGLVVRGIGKRKSLK